MTQRATRDAYGRALVELAGERSDVVVLDADLSRSTRTEWFAERYLTRFFNVGIAEQNMIGMAAGLALSGLVPFATTYAVFIARALDQIRQAVCYNRANVKIVATHAGLAASYDGGSHQGTEDLAFMRVLPGMTILCPADYAEAYAAVGAAAEHTGPVYIRLQKEPVADLPGPPAAFTIGRARLLRDGDDLAVITAGGLASHALAAADELAGEGISVRVLQLSTLKPLDTDALHETARCCRVLLTVEEHNVIGGLHEAVMTALGGRYPVVSYALGLHECFGESGSWKQLLDRFGLDARGIVAAARRALPKGVVAL
ncbi:MAG TPA: transketolase C-terminal domain-containing protein [Thermoanaerobaculia bacterium]|jgi:transketolase|nr:transketolase C-terminal domain-containing protein [Thermoanaerobaculia bacterium]